MESYLSTGVVAGVVLRQDGKYLLVQEGKPECRGSWSLPAGRVEAGDTLEGAAAREAREETGLEVEIGRKLGVWQQRAEDPVKHVFAATIIGGSLRPQEGEILDVQWFSAEEIRGMRGILRDPFVLEAIAEAEGDKQARAKAGVDYTGVTISFYCHDGAGNFLLHKRSQTCRDEQGTWDCGGGKLEFGEDLEEGIRREVKEEYGCDCEVGERIAVYSRSRTNREGKPTHWVAVGHFVKVDPSQARLNEPESMDEIGWFSRDALPQPMHSSCQMIFEKYADTFAALGA